MFSINPKKHIFAAFKEINTEFEKYQDEFYFSSELGLTQ